MDELHPYNSDPFPGGVPPGEYFRMVSDDLISLVSMNGEDDRFTHKIPSLAFIGLVSYFEAFCKDHAASLMNIHPPLVNRLRKRKLNTTVDAVDLLDFELTPAAAIGYLVAENLNFGPPKDINRIFKAMLGVCPFSEPDAERYTRIREDRHLLVHHGGIYTTRYLKSHPVPDVPERHRVFMDSIKISPARVKSDTEFLQHAARQIVRLSHNALCKRIESEEGTVPEDTKQSLFMMRWWGAEGA